MVVGEKSKDETLFLPPSYATIRSSLWYTYNVLPVPCVSGPSVLKKKVTTQSSQSLARGMGGKEELRRRRRKLCFSVSKNIMLLRTVHLSVRAVVGKKRSALGDSPLYSG